MPIKRCCVKNCKSSSTRNEDKGVTYHKYPKDAKLRDTWTAAAHSPPLKLVPRSFVCSRHFCKGDFIKNKDSKYNLKSDAVPSIFPWELETINMEPQASGNEAEATEEPLKPINEVKDANISGSNKGSVQEKSHNRKSQSSDGDVYKSDENVEGPVESGELPVVDLEINFKNVEKLVENGERPAGNVEMAVVNVDEETMAVASSVMEMILSKTEAKALTDNVKPIPKQTINPGNNSMPLSVGSKVEAKDFSGEWYPAQIVEVDFDEMEVLVHYDNSLKKSDEWINVSSPRLRPFSGTSVPKPKEQQHELIRLLKEVKEEPKEDPKETKVEDKSKVFVVGERCLTRWRDNRRFVATIDKDLGDGKFEVIFDDNFRWTCPISRLSKLKDTRDVLTIDTTLPSTSGAPSPVLQGGPSSGSPSPIPTFHTHLFDPTRDYLGSKSERREKKRKLNIKEIFNIGQKKQKVPKVEKYKTPKAKKVVKKTVKPKTKTLEVKTEQRGIPDAVASIIGTDVTQEIKIEMCEEHTEPMEVDDLDSTDKPDESSDSKSDLDPVDKEDKLERFDKPDQVMHEKLMDKMKKSISKLEGGLNAQIEKVHLPREVRVDLPKQAIDLQPIIDPRKLVTDTQKLGTDAQESLTETPKMVTDSKTVIETLRLETPMPAIEPIIHVTETLKVEIEAPSMDIKALVADAPSPSLIAKSEADLNMILPDDDTTKSDIEMGNESPRLDIDSQPILVDIDAPLDVDPPELKPPLSDVKKIKKPKCKDKSKKIKKEHKDCHTWDQMSQVKSELFEMQIRMKEMIQEMQRDKMEKQAFEGVPLPESFLLAGEWACRWVNGQPVGKVSEMEADGKPDASGKTDAAGKPDASGKPALPRRSVEVVDKRLPEGWTKHMVRRSVGHSAGKWDVVLVSPTNRRFHTKIDMRNYLVTADKATKAYEHPLMDFGVHLKRARKMGWIRITPDGITEAPETILPADSVCSLSPLVKRKSLSLKRRPEDSPKVKDKSKKRPIKLKLQRRMQTYKSQLIDTESGTSAMATNVPEQPLMPELEDGYVWVGSLKVQMIENLLRCPAEGCLKNFRNNTLLKMHIKHYHRELRKLMGATPKVLELAAARSKPTLAEHNRAEAKAVRLKTNKPKREEPKPETFNPQEQELKVDVGYSTPTKDEAVPKVPRSQDSPKLRNALINKPVKRPRVLLPVRRADPDPPVLDGMSDDNFETSDPSSKTQITDVLDFETAISTHTVTKPLDKKKKVDKKQKSFASFSKNISEEEEWFAMNSDDLDTRSSFPRSGTPDDSKVIDTKTGLLTSSDTMEDPLDPSLYALTETGERVKIVHMKREEIINCHCGFREEDGLMVQCELCLCWQHALCHNIQKESEVPEKYTCSICLNPRRGRRGKRFVHDQDRLYEGLLPGARPAEALRRSHELAGNLLRIEDALHALRVKCYVATKKDHPKLYLWAKDWEQTEIPYKLNSDYSDLSIMINGMDKENLPMKPDDLHLVDMRTASEDDQDSDRYSQRDGQLGSQALLSGLLSSPSATSLDLPISTSELERLAKTVQEAAAEWQGQPAPQPEAPIDNDVCRERLLQHIQRCQALIDARLDSIEAQVAELESQEPSFGEHYETAEHYPRIKQTVQMLMRDLETMEELGLIT